jgi:gliding motility-associated-like protein
MMKKGLFTIVFLLVCWASFAQAPILIADTDGDISEVGLPNSCSKRLIKNVSISLSDITLHPNGKMYGCSFSQRKFYEIDTTNGTTTELFTFPSGTRPVGMTAAANGKVYVSEGDGVPSRLFEVNVTNNTFVVKGLLANGSAGDLTWSNGEMYNVSEDNKLVKINIETPENSIVIGEFNTNTTDIFSLVTNVYSCDSSVTYGITEDRQYFIIDLSNANTTALCVGSGARIFGSTSRDEFRASDTCLVTIDLDDNNSSGAIGSDFFSNFECVTSNSNIADVDVTIESLNPIDSIVVRIRSGILDGANEFLQLGSTPNINANNNNIKISAINGGIATIEDFETFLKTLVYRNTASQISSGDRIIEVLAYSNNGVSNVSLATISISESVDAGTNASVSLCSNQAPFNLFNSLGGAPDAGGVWSPLLASNSNIFNPSVDPAGIYTYIISNSCNADSATVTVTINDGVDAGQDSSISLCSNAEPIDLFDILGGNPTAGGTWSPALNSNTGVFDPNNDSAGTYTYSVIGCNTASASVVVTLNENSNAGEDNAITFCSSDASINLLNSLGGNPQAGGTWSPTLNSNTNIFNPSLDPEGTYIYVINNGCGIDSATLQITIDNAISAGFNGSLNICTNDAAIDLFNSLNGSPDIGGTWSPTLNSGTGIFNPTLDSEGIFTYTITGCNTSSASVLVEVNALLNPGNNNELIFCSNSDTTFNLSIALGNNFVSGGIWTPALNSGNNTYSLANDGEGLFTYTVTNSCGSANATIDVSIQNATEVNAGEDNSITVEASDSPFDLFTVLGGTPDINGVWTPNLQSGTGVFNPSIDQSGVYTYTVSNLCSSDFANVTVLVDEEDFCLFSSLFVPNAFTPNGDGLNDELLVYYVGTYDSFDFRIYNRWGGLVFETDNIEIGWDGIFEGKLQSTDVFGYVLNLKCDDQIEQRKGNITILR